MYPPALLEKGLARRHGAEPAAYAQSSWWAKVLPPFTSEPASPECAGAAWNQYGPERNGEHGDFCASPNQDRGVDG